MKLKKNAFLMVAVLFANNTLAQTKSEPFKGSIVYEVNVQAKSDIYNQDKLSSMYGTFTTFYYNDGIYLQTYQDADIKFDYLNSKIGKYFIKFSTRNALLEFEAIQEKNNKLISFEQINEREKVLNYDCKAIKLKMESLEYEFQSSVTFWYTNKLKIDYKQFESTKKFFLNRVYRAMESLPLKILIENNDYKIIMTASKIEFNEAVNVQKMFKDLSAGLEIKKMD